MTSAEQAATEYAARAIEEMPEPLRNDVCIAVNNLSAALTKEIVRIKAQGHDSRTDTQS